MFDATLSVIQTQVETIEPDPEAGRLGGIMLLHVIGIAVPVGNGQLAQIPVGIVRVPMDRETAIEQGTALTEAGEALPEPAGSGLGDFVVASNMTQAEQEARSQEALRGHRPQR